MEHITFTCRVITPMFLAGADGRTPELRAPSIKGAMRFWWRALHGHLVEEKNGRWDYTELKKQEGELFGDTRRKSSFNISVEEISSMEEFEFNAEFSREIQYFQYSLIHHNNRKGIKPGFRFSIRLSAFSREVLLEATYLLWILSHYGGLGTRVRRGAGAFTVLEKEYDEKGVHGLEFLEETPISTGLTRWSKEKIATEYSNIGSQTLGFIHRNGFATWEMAMKDIAKRMMEVRDGDTIKSMRGDNARDSVFSQSELNKKAAFGLPIKVRNEKELVNLAHKNSQGKYENARRASPIYISVTRIRGMYHWTVIFLEGTFMPADSKIVFKNEQWQKEDDSLVVEFRKRLELACEDAFYDGEESSVKKIKTS